MYRFKAGDDSGRAFLRNEIMAGCRKHFAEVERLQMQWLCHCVTLQDKEARDLVALVEQHKAEVQREKDSGVDSWQVSMHLCKLIFV